MKNGPHNINKLIKPSKTLIYYNNNNNNGKTTRPEFRR